jgi:signal transduction histidine kinase
MYLENIDFSLRSQLEHAVSVLAVRARKRGVELLCDVSPDVPDHLIGDPGRLFQIFVNLIGKFGGVSL